MVSEIKGNGLPNLAQATAATDSPVRKPAAGAAAPASVGGSADVVTLTDLAARLQRLTESVDKLPEVDRARVTALRDEIEGGNYRIDEQQIADKLTAFEALLGGGKV